MTPDRFIPLAEHTGLIQPLTLQVIEESIKQVKEWQRGGLDITVAVNLSVRNLLDIELPGQIDEILKRWDVSAQSLELEVTESGIIADPVRAASVLSELSGMGITVAIDDFGTGYSSLSYLKRLPVDEIKIDKSFVMNMLADENDAVIVRSTIEMGRNLGLKVVAEGVETEQSLHEVTALGADVAQGFHFARPMPPEEFLEWRRAAYPVAETVAETLAPPTTALPQLA